MIDSSRQPLHHEVDERQHERQRADDRRHREVDEVEPQDRVVVLHKGTIVALTPPGEANQMVDVIVRSPTGQEAVVPRAFMYDPRYR